MTMTGPNLSFIYEFMSILKGWLKQEFPMFYWRTPTRDGWDDGTAITGSIWPQNTADIATWVSIVETGTDDNWQCILEFALVNTWPEDLYCHFLLNEEKLCDPSLFDELKQKMNRHLRKSSLII